MGEFSVCRIWPPRYLTARARLNVTHQRLPDSEAYYEGRDGNCVKSDEYTTGQAWYHPTHTHMAVNEGHDTAKITSIAFDVPTKSATTPPVVGNVTDVYDFTPLPPADCPRLR